MRKSEEDEEEEGNGHEETTPKMSCREKKRSFKNKWKLTMTRHN